MKRQKSILLLEDEQEIGQLMLNLIEPIYEEVIFCDSPAQAKDVVQRRPFSLILTDVMMPGLPGQEFVKFIRSVGRIEPVIFVTGNSTREILLTALRLGVSDVIEKPFEESDLIQSIDRALDIERRRFGLYENIILSKSNDIELLRQKRMIGLLQVANTIKTSQL